MLTNCQIDRVLGKLKRFETTLEPMLFEPITSLDAQMYETEQNLDSAPVDAAYIPAKKGAVWGGEWKYCWFQTEYTVPEEYANIPLFLKADVGGQESMLFIDGVPSGIFTIPQNGAAHGYHYCDLITMGTAANTHYHFDLEAYAWHYTPGSQPMVTNPMPDFLHHYNSIEVCVKNPVINQFYFDLKTFDQMTEVLDANSFVRAEIIKTLMRVHEIVYYSPDDTDKETFLAAIKEAQKELTKLYQYKNTSLAPVAKLVGHSHMDTAWHWPIDQTIKKCARTFSNQLKLMEEYPEYRFIQSSSYHSYMMKVHYPSLYEGMKKAIASGRYEPNGAVWVECDCNIPGGEWMVRQFVWGQLYTQKEFGYLSDCFWLPDTFGYSAALPQIMKSCRVDYFLTTKISWNDTNPFPYDTFLWKGIDGTQVLSHFNRNHLWPDPQTLTDAVMDGHNSGDTIHEKTVTNKRLLSYGFGDGGGGPLFEMIEMARRCADIEGCPKAETTSVSDFMNEIEGELTDPSVYRGELYLELHRGTLTNQHVTKRNNRKAENALHNAEFALVRHAVCTNTASDPAVLRPIINLLLVNQFHDILPGTCIHAVHERSHKETATVIEQATANAMNLFASDACNTDKNGLTVINPIGFARKDAIYLDESVAKAHGILAQSFKAIDGKLVSVLPGVAVDSYAAAVIDPIAINAACSKESPFTASGNTLDTPFYTVQFNDKMYLSSLFDKRTKRELCENGQPLNTFLLAEDVPLAWDNWDIDADIEYKLRDTATLLESQVVSCGPIEYRIRNRYQLTARSSLTQDIVFYADDPMIRFDTRMDWQDDHRLLKTAFPTSILSDFARQEIQFGHVKRPTTRNTSIEKAKFEVCNHRFTDLSELRYGVSLLNDCKYGISVKDGCMALTLHKGGCRPDAAGDKGIHDCTYALLPHIGDFSSDTVIRAAYCINDPVSVVSGRTQNQQSFVSSSESNVIIETIKPAEGDATNCYILRIYEAEGCASHAEISFGHSVKSVEETNMLEEKLEDVPVCENKVALSLRPFEIKTLRVTY